MGTTPLIGAFKNICYCKSSYPEISADNSVVLKNSSRGLLLRVAYVDVSIQPSIKHYHHRHTCLWLDCILLPEGAANVRTKNTVQSQTPLDVHSQNRVQGNHKRPCHPPLETP